MDVRNHPEYVDILRVIVLVHVQYGTVIIKQSWNQLENGKQGTRTIQAINVATKGGVGSKNDRRAGTHFFEPGGYKIEPLPTKMVNDDI